MYGAGINATQIDTITVYYAYIYSKIQYGIEVDGRACPTALEKGQTQQNGALKILYNRDFRSSTLSLHKDLNILLAKRHFHIFMF